MSDLKTLEARWPAIKEAYRENPDDPRKRRAYEKGKAALTAARNEARADRTEFVGEDHKGRPVYRRVTPLVRAE